MNTTASTKYLTVRYRHDWDVSYDISMQPECDLQQGFSNKAIHTYHEHYQVSYAHMIFMTD